MTDWWNLPAADPRLVELLRKRIEDAERVFAEAFRKAIYDACFSSVCGISLAEILTDER